MTLDGNCSSSFGREGDDLADRLRQLFPYFSRCSDGGAYLDAAASTPKLQVCIERLTEYLSYEHANVHRGAYALSASATELFEEARQAVHRFLGLSADYEVIFTSGATDSINIVAHGVAPQVAGRSVIATELEHHSNFVPWQQICLRHGGQFIVAPITKSAEVEESKLIDLIETENPLMLALTAQSNAFGTIPRCKEIIKAAHARGVRVMLDATQSVVHEPFSIQDTPADFIVFSGHKVYGPTGIGVLAGRREALTGLIPYRTGGGMIERVKRDSTTFAQIPARFEAGTPPIGEAVALGATLDFLQNLRIQHDFCAREAELFRFAWDRLSGVSRVQLVGPGPQEPARHRSIISFLLEGVHPHDFASIADTFGVQVRAGHHCVMPAMEVLGFPSTARISFGIYSKLSDIDRLLEAVDRALAMFP